MKYFNQATNVNEAKALYRELCFKYHPDLHTNEWEKYNELMKEINSEYQSMLNLFNGQSFVGTDNKEHIYHYNQDIEEEIAQKIQDLVSCGFPEHIKIWLIGTWIWVEGVQYKDIDVRKQLKALKMRWHSKRKMWYFRLAQYKRSYSKKSFDELKEMYGATEYENEKKSAIGAD